jgi:hypothetical protein
MAQAIGAVLVFAVGVGVSPIPIIAGILLLFSARATINGPVFLAAWIVGLTAVLSVIVLLAEATDLGSGSAADDATSWSKVILGVVLLGLAARRWRRRPGPGDEPVVPAWLAKVHDTTPTGACWLGLGLAANPKNLALAFGAGTSLVALGPSLPETMVGAAAFVLVGSALLIVAVTYAAVGGDGAQRVLEQARAWLSANNDTVMIVLLVVFGAVLISNGLVLA